MNFRFLFLILAVLLSIVSASAQTQKGVDTQTQKIRDDTNRTSPRGTGPTRSFDWGRDKTVVRDRLPNPYVLSARRDVLVEKIVEVLTENKFIVDEASSRLKEGIVVTEPHIIGKGAVLAESMLRRYAYVEDADYAWSRGQFSLTIEVQPIDGTRNNVTVNAKIEGRSGTGIRSEWKTLPSSGLAEEEFLIKLVEAMIGSVPEDNPR